MVLNQQNQADLLREREELSRAMEKMQLEDEDEKRRYRTRTRSRSDRPSPLCRRHTNPVLCVVVLTVGGGAARRTRPT